MHQETIWTRLLYHFYRNLSESKNFHSFYGTFITFRNFYMRKRITDGSHQTFFLLSYITARSKVPRFALLYALHFRSGTSFQNIRRSRYIWVRGT